MKVTAALKKELAQWLDTYWTTYLKGDIETWSTFISDDYRNIGGTREEIWNSKQEIIDYTNSILDQMIGTVDIRNRQVELIPYGEYMMVNEFTDLYVKIEGEWIFYGPFRMSSLLEKTDTGWIALHQHGSYPDMKAMEGEAFSIDALKAENAKLQAAVKSRTLELEHNNRELEIEAAVERVRSRSMAMHKSVELKEVIQVVYDQFIQLNINVEHTGFIVDYKEREDMHIWLADQYASPFEISIPYFDSPHWNSFLAAKQKGEQFFSNLLPFEVKNKFYQDLFKLIPTLPQEAQQAIFSKPALAISTVLLDNVGLYIENFSGTPFTEDENNTLMRFGKVFQQTYTRFLDLQKAEAQAREAHIEIALEKVRSRTMAMQHSDELADASFLLDSQVRSLGIKTRGCAFNIYGDNESTEWFSSEMGTLPTYKTPRENVFLRYYETGKKGALIHIEEFAGEACKAHYDYLCTIPIIGDGLKKMIADGGSFPTRQIDHVVYFKYGYLLFITLEPADEAQEVFLRFAKVFEQTYTRFLDLKKAEAQALQAESDLMAIKEAKQKAEYALRELQVTQKQLIQAEKMASLGELTAGIAHEIQNPLNFVNNFSEVSKELLDEMKEAIENGDTEEAKEIMKDVIQNLEKIYHHGKRADGIVKGMLQHSRSSSGKKAPTDINVLTDEYLRLAYHGLRAKDKSFNAALKTGYDESIGNINIIPQDIGRVILNLITNAFYAVCEKQNEVAAGKPRFQHLASPYEPTVSVSTKKMGDTPDNYRVLIAVKDNGNGISPDITDKIFQPFFTTKPTGQGTGLGLSLSYDIVKAHGGELTVETQEGKGSVFSIQLPAK
jgi:signal transduction histidine kinase